MNFCRSCNRDFTSVRDFDSHRVGVHAYLWNPEHEDGRRCLDFHEMRGWSQDRHGRWRRRLRKAPNFVREVAQESLGATG